MAEADAETCVFSGPVTQARPRFSDFRKIEKLINDFLSLPGTCTNKCTITFLFWVWKKLYPARPQPTTLISRWADGVPEKHAASASDIIAVRPALLMGGRGGSAVGVVVVVPGTSSYVGRMMGNRGVEGWRN